eukprot:3926854-Ditylum_brightwellii.AAC.1
MAKEVKALQDMECFECCKHGHRPGKEYQQTTLHMDFDCKQDGRQKVQFVAGGYLIDLLDHDVYSSTVKGISICLLHVIAHSANVEVLCGDIGNAYVNSYTTEKVDAATSPEFSSKIQGKLRAYTVELVGPSEYYLGSNFKKDSKERWMMGCKKYITEALTR